MSVTDRFRDLRRLVCAFTLIAAGLGLAGCSPEARRARYEKQADAFYQAGRFDRAEIEYLNLYKLAPTHAHTLSRLGTIALNQGRMGRALELLSRAKMLAPRDPESLRALGLLYLGVGYRVEARAEAMSLLDVSPEDPDAPIILAETVDSAESLTAVKEKLQALGGQGAARAPVQVALGMLEAREGRIDQAEQSIRKAITLDPRSAAAHAALGALLEARQDPVRADESLSRSAALAGSRSPYGVRYAQFKIRRGDSPGGRRILEEIVAEAPDFLPARLRLADLGLNEGRLEEASAQLAPVLAIDPTHAEALLLSSRLHLAQNDTTQALSQIELLLRMYPRSPEALFQHARILIARKDLTAALGSLKQTLALKPEDREATLELARLYLQQGERGAAIVVLRDWLAKLPGPSTSPSFLEGYVLLAEALRLQGDFDETLKLYDLIERISPGREQLAVMRGLVHRQRGKPLEARAALLEALQRNPEAILAIEQLVELDLAEGKTIDARARVDTALRAQPRQAALVILSARLFLATRDLTSADAALRRALELDPKLSQPYLLLAQIQMDRGDNPAALESLRAAVQRAPANSEAWFQLAHLLEKANDFPAARNAYEALLKVDPRHTGALNNLAHLLFHELKETERGYTLARQARDLAPSDPNIADTLGWILFHRRDFVWALGLLRESVGKTPDSPEALHHLAMTQYMLCDEPAAQQGFERALALQTPFRSAAEARARLEIIRLAGAKIDAAGRAMLEKHLQTHPDDPVALIRLSALHESEGRTEEAITSLERAVKSSPYAVPPALALVRLLVDTGRTAQALERARATRKLAPEDVAVAYELGQQAFRLRDFLWAYTLLRDAARRPTAPAEVLHAFAASAYSIGRVAEARASLAAAVASAPTPEARERLALIDASRTPASATSALSMARQRITADNRDVAALMVIATASPATEAQPMLERVLSIYPDFVPAKRQLAFLLFPDPTQDRRTLELATQAYEILRDDAELSRLLGNVSYRLVDYRRAIGWLDNAKSGFANDASLWFLLGMSQSAVQQTTPARESLEKALALGLTGHAAEEATAKLQALKAGK